MSPRRPHGPRVVMLGFRGFPNVQGGVERHVEALAPRLVAAGFDVEALGRRPYLPKPEASSWRGVTIVPLWAPRRKSIETILHSAWGVLAARRRGADLVHIHSIGAALVVPLARLVGLRVVVTHHGYDYDRGKWGPVARLALRLGEWAGMRFAHGRIAISRDVATTMQRRYGVPVSYLPNGVDVIDAPSSTTTLAELGLEPGRYVVTVGRLVQEKRHLDLIAGFARLAEPGLKLVIVGAADHPDAYSRSVEAAAAATPNVVMAGFRKGTALAELYAHAGLFVLPSSHEGMPIALLEALSFGLPVLASDIVANRELALAAEDYFPLGDQEALARAMRDKLASPAGEADRRVLIAQVAESYGWSSVALGTARVYREVLRDQRSPIAVSEKSGSRS